jgi:hypothetical protein
MYLVRISKISPSLSQAKRQGGGSSNKVSCSSLYSQGVNGTEMFSIVMG